MSHPFSLRQLEYVVALADTLSFRRAAEQCNVSQPSLSAQISQLEEAIGLRLFERDRRRVLVAPQAVELIARARLLLRAAADVEVCARLSGDAFGGTMRIGIIPTISPYLLPRIAPVLRAEYPRLHLEWTEEKTALLAEQLESGSLDAILAAREAPLGDVALDIVAEDRFLVAASPSHVLGRSTRPVRISELAGQNVLLLADGHCFRDQALAVCASANAQELAFRATSLTTLVQMVAGGDAITLLPELAAGVEGRRLKLRKFADAAPRRTIVLARRKSSARGEALREIARTIRRVAQAGGPGGTRSIARRR